MKLIKVAKEIDRILKSGIEIMPNSPIHAKLAQSLSRAGTNNSDGLGEIVRLPENQHNKVEVCKLCLYKDVQGDEYPCKRCELDTYEYYR